MVGLRQTVLRRRYWCAALVGSAMLVAAPAALAQDATWLTNPGSSEFNTAANWTPASVPTGFASFDTSSITTLTFSGSRNLDGFTFNSGAPVYTFNLTSGFGINFHTDGIINNSANAPIFTVSNSPLRFDDSSTAGNAIINLNAGTVQFLGSSTAGTAQLNAAAGTTFDFTGTLGPVNNGIFSAGSISGEGNFDLGVGNRLVVGSNDLSTTVSGTIVSGAITKVGAGTLTLSGSNTYAGGTTLSSGTLMIGNSNALGSGNLSMAPGTTLSSDTLAAYNVANNISIAGDPIFNVDAGPVQTVSGIISDSDPANKGIVEKTGAGTLALSGDNTYSGGTTISAGTLQVSKGTTPGVSSSVGIGAVTMNGGTFQSDGVANLTFDNAFKVNTSGGTIDNNGSALTLAGNITNGNGTTGALTFNSSVTFAGTTVLSGTNTYSGGTSVVATTVQVTNGSALGTGEVKLDAGTLQTNGTNVTIANAIKLDNTTDFFGFRGGFLDANGATLTISGNITGPGTLEVVDSTVANHAVVLTGTNTYSGNTIICNCSTLQLGTSVTSGSILGAVTNEGIFDIVNANTSGITTVTNQAGAYTIFRNSTDAGTMTIDNQSFGSVEFRQTSSAGNAVINNNIGSSTTFFNGSTAGNASINNIAGFGVGVVEFNNKSTAGAATINNAGFSYVVFNNQSSAGSALITNTDQGQVHFYDQSTAGSATITNNNSGILDFNNRTSAENAIIVNSSAIGMAFLDQSTAGNAFITTNNNSATFFFNRSDGGTALFETEAGSIVDFSGSRGPLTDRKIHAGSIAGAGDYFIGSRNTLIVGGNNLSTEVSGGVADSCGCSPGGPGGALEKVGTGTLILSGTNTYSGGTTITAGTLQLGNGTTTGSILGNVTDNATLAFNRSNAYQFDGVISGSGVVQQNGSGTTILTAVNSYGGGTAFNAGKLSIAADANLGASTGALTFNGGTLQFTNNLALTLSSTRAITLQSGGGGIEVTNGNVIIGQAIGGSGALTKSGSGFLLLNGNNTYGGGTTISAGTLVLGNGGTTGSITGNVVNNGLLTFNRSDRQFFL
jgi:autotransporter-associated beta strand protein